MTLPPPVTIDLGHDEVLTGAAASWPRPPSQTAYLVAVGLWFMLAMELGLGIAFMASQNFDPPQMVLMHQALSLALPAMLFLIGLTFINNTYLRIQAKGQARDRAERGVPGSVAATYRLDDEGLRLSTERGAWLSRWPSISSVVSAHEGWLFVHDLGSTYIPARAFADASAERAFLAATWARLGASARQRSAALAARAET